MTTATAAEGNEFSLIRNHLLNVLREKLAQSSPYSSALDGLRFFRYEQPTIKSSYTQEPSICIILQGAKRVFLGQEGYTYDSKHFLMSAVDLPFVASIVEATPEQPYLGLAFRFDRNLLTELVLELQLSPRKMTASKSAPGLGVAELTLPILSAMRRLIDLDNEPQSIPTLGNAYQRELLYRVLQSPLGYKLCQTALTDSKSSQVSKAIGWLKENYAAPLRIEQLAQLVGMGSSTLHHHFKTMTAMSPLSFQKWLRLHEARRLMLSQNIDVATACYTVGYESPSQFSREYSRQFGAAPSKDIRKLKATF